MLDEAGWADLMSGFLDQAWVGMLEAQCIIRIGKDEVYWKKSANAISEEAGPPGERDRQEDPEPVGVLNPAQEGSEGSSAGEGNRQRTENKTDGGVVKLGKQRGLRGVEAPTATDTTNVEDALKRGDAKGPAKF
ncbi:hypothetical protein NDU88_003429 [Pleurodeles waltl]|uniref:Uncharacterized protein n=1 Tax=Pleurodeles waltl TaxID=8319 RepID=A0AAV7UCI4_PLEWA|nr:hypothetical protein NDU88_003429 [Pleurodeles waltl]